MIELETESLLINPCIQLHTLVEVLLFDASRSSY